ncbi:MAG: hypothetical protein JW797_07765 [Bradymonadales bacterium]|nr:hypothetical protein [Bradymonadales bacterium]
MKGKIWVILGTLFSYLLGCSDPAEREGPPDTFGDLPDRGSLVDLPRSAIGARESVEIGVSDQLLPFGELWLEGILLPTSHSATGDNLSLSGFVAPHVHPMRSEGGDLSLEHMALAGHLVGDRK